MKIRLNKSIKSYYKRFKFVKLAYLVLFVLLVVDHLLFKDYRLGGLVVELSKKEIERYARHLVMPEVGIEGQKKMLQARVLLIGAGGLGSPIAFYLTAAGIGNLGIVDFDVVDESNLQRQILHNVNDVGRLKVDSAKEKILNLNPNIKVDTYNLLLNKDNILDVIKNYDIVVDGTDNFQTRYLVNDACVMHKKPLIYGSIFRFEGQCSVFMPEGPCYRCLYSDPPPPGMVPSCSEGGVLGILPGIIGLMQATEVVKLILGKGKSLAGRLILYDAMDMAFDEVQLRQDPNCKLCGENPTITELINYEQFCGIQKDDQSNQDMSMQNISVQELKKILDKDPSDITLIDVREEEEYQISRIPRSQLIPLSTLDDSEELNKLDKSSTIYVHCKSGFRSQKAITKMKELGFLNLYNVSGGILAWCKEIDSSIATY